MRSFDLTFPGRFRLNQLLDAVPGPAGRIRPALEILKQTSFTEAEFAQIKQIPLGDGRVTITPPPDLDFGAITVTLEESDATALIAEIENSTTITALDFRTWAGVILDSLKAAKQPFTK